MATQLERSSLTTSIQMNVGSSGLPSETFEVKIARFERVALRLFNVSNCLINLGDFSTRFDPNERSMASFEAMFCQSLPLASDLLVAGDAANHPVLSTHELVLGAPYIRFYVAYPITDQTNNVIGNIVLIDYQAREFDDESRLLLADLAVLIEREIAFGVMHQAQLELIKQNRSLKRDSLIDPVLGTWNKAAIVRSLKIEMERCSKAEKPLSLIFSTLDQILSIRDKHGIAFSDIAMIRVVSRIRSCVRPFDALGRFGNDIFLIVLPGASHLVATAVAERIRISVMSHPDTIEQELVSLTVSAGIVSTDMFPAAEPEVLISLAEKALLSAKQAGSNHVAQATIDQPDIII
ncbi:diguanylate cyclase [Undibacterium sp. RTI2.1]|uniref:GGDEF domain-containing protein n=1 Tax=unclassified Undibacterium TaxID=2630295 RepID=UPI002AB4B057|nr:MULTISPECIES: diguanylate cyclase [unclassified Undibacterium]MDY7537284.1 diguanylate cyclase [Undibacterium sp. 5I1]MEB0032768.1 diguanylate cyclase [Undibacterium sp. RTI2.1]MEB0117533.1 diguanylate cyclase [Undibacterium sp. RTI2.2]MEB0230303.1 diguanylate cyclase [Undibacterium sp. 10I3]MEB0258187.1 diguanylate cyclase [Undibacterium sp. 5I1]